MTFTTKHHVLLLGFITCLGTNLLQASARKARLDPSNPNIVFILADDWGWGDLGCHGHPWLKTPNIDRLASEGTEFYQYTVASGVCSPSRTAIMTGRFPARFSIHGHFATVESHRRRGMPDWLDPKTIVLPRLLRQNGYATGHFGKWHLTNIMVPDAPLPTSYGYDEYGAFNCSGPQMPVHDDVRRSIEFMEQCADQEKPFFINLWIHEPHTPHYPQSEYLSQFPHLENEADRIYAAVLAHADARIGQLLAALRRLNLDDDTLVFFSSDNGPEDTGPASRRMTQDESTGPGFGSFASVGTTGGRRGRKRSLLQGGIGVPFIVRWPGKIAAGRVDRTTPITAVDLLPTICAATGVTLPAAYIPDGENQLPALLGTAKSARATPIFWEWKSASPRGDRWPALAVRQGSWKLLLGKNAERTELFRFPGDDLEKHNLYREQPEQVHRLSKLLDAWKQSLPSEPNAQCLSKQRKR